MAVWPSTIPVTRDNYMETPGDRVTRSSMEIGPAKLRRRTSATPRNVSLRLFLTTAQVDTLDDFFEANDAVAFDFTDPRTNTIKRARFTSPPSYNLNETMWDAAVKLEYLP